MWNINISNLYTGKSKTLTIHIQRYSFLILRRYRVYRRLSKHNECVMQIRKFRVSYFHETRFASGASLFSGSKINSVTNDSAFSFVRARQNLRASFRKESISSHLFSSNVSVKDTRRNWISHDTEISQKSKFIIYFHGMLAKQRRRWCFASCSFNFDFAFIYLIFLFICVINLFIKIQRY